jgi:hypothetical protein
MRRRKTPHPQATHIPQGVLEDPMTRAAARLGVSIFPVTSMPELRKTEKVPAVASTLIPSAKTVVLDTRNSWWWGGEGVCVKEEHGMRSTNTAHADNSRQQQQTTTINIVTAEATGRMGGRVGAMLPGCLQQIGRRHAWVGCSLQRWRRIQRRYG